MVKRSQSHDITRVLLALWDLGGTEVKRGDLRPRIVRKGEKSSQYEDILQELEQAGAIARSKATISLCQPKGLEMLSAGLQEPDFMFSGAIIGTKTANALLRWIREMNSQSVVAAPAPKNGKANTAIESYVDFQKVALDVYDRLNRDYNLDDLVPIYRIRREIGDRVTRSNFDEWLIKMQGDDSLQLIGGEMPELTPDKADDSIKTALGGVRYYVKRLA
jgi:hypothetical protein